jgi:hypothetical protein
MSLDHAYDILELGMTKEEIVKKLRNGFKQKTQWLGY